MGSQGKCSPRDFKNVSWKIYFFCLKLAFCPQRIQWQSAHKYVVENIMHQRKRRSLDRIKLLFFDHQIFAFYCNWRVNRIVIFLIWVKANKIRRKRDFSFLSRIIYTTLHTNSVKLYKHQHQTLKKMFKWRSVAGIFALILNQTVWKYIWVE